LLKVWSVVALLEATAVIMGMLQIGPSMFYSSPEFKSILSTGEFNRGFGTYLNPNAAGAYLSISFFVMLAAPWKRWVRLAGGLYLLASIYATGSMGAMLSTVVALVILVVAYGIQRDLKKTLLASGLLAMAVAASFILYLVFQPMQLIPPISAYREVEGLLALTVGRLADSFSGRLEIIRSSWQVYEHYPLGIGPDTSKLFTRSVHNDYLAFLFERGPLGMVGLLWFVWATLVLPWREKGAGQDSQAGWQLLALWAGFAACLMNALSHEVSHFRQLWMLLGFLYAGSYMLPPLRKSAGAKVRRSEN
jgi:hypothetical protein